MGTNYYVKLKDKNTLVHVGKFSRGWMFLFAPNPDYYDKTRTSINRFLKLHKNEFYDEYGDLVDIDEFWSIVDNKKDLICVIRTKIWCEEEIITEEGLRFAGTNNFS